MSPVDFVDFTPARRVELETTLASLEAAWHGVADWLPASDAQAVLGAWAGYAVSLSDPAAPVIKVFLRDVPDADRVASLFDQIPGPIPIFVEKGITFKALSGPISPGAALTCEATGTGPTVGTVGGFVRDQDGVNYILSANHVLALNNAFGAVQIKIGGRVVAGQIEFVEIDPARENQVDVAIARWNGVVDFRSGIPGLGLARGNAVSPVRAGAQVTKLSSSGKTTASFLWFYPHASVELDSCHISMADFAGFLAVEDAADTPFAVPGDSGALAVVGADGNREPLGLLVAREDRHGAPGRYTLIEPFAAALNAIQGKIQKRLTLLI